MEEVCGASPVQLRPWTTLIDLMDRGLLDPVSHLREDHHYSGVDDGSLDQTAEVDFFLATPHSSFGVVFTRGRVIAYASGN